MISCLLSWLTGLLRLCQYVVLMTTFLHWSLLATQELHRFCRYIAELDRTGKESSGDRKTSESSSESPVSVRLRNNNNVVRKCASDIAVNRDKHRTIFLAADKVELDNDDDRGEEEDEEDLTDIEVQDSEYDNSVARKVDDVVDARRDHVFVKLAESQDLEEILEIFNQIKGAVGLSDRPESFKDVFPKLEEELSDRIPHRYSELLRLLRQRSVNKEYCDNKVASGQKVLIVGGGPCGLRMAVEMQYLGAKTTVIESRPYMDRNNVIKLWSFVMEDLKGLGAKKLYSQFGNGSVNHISIRMLQLILLKISLLLGTAVYIRESFLSIAPPAGGKGWSVVTEVRCRDGSVFHCVEEYDILICATGRKVPIKGFDRKSLDAKMSIAITANFVNKNTLEERRVAEIPGLSKQYDLEFFRQMEAETGIRLENIVYYKDLTHYFVMTVKKDSLVRKGVIKTTDLPRETLLHPTNIDQAALESFAVEAATFSTGHFSCQLPTSQFQTWKGKSDVSIFDFTNLYTSRNACQVLERAGHQLLVAVVGDSLMQPFWPEGTGIGRGFLSVLDTAWLARRWLEVDRSSRTEILEVIREREKLYSLLRQTSPGQLQTCGTSWSIRPGSRYCTRQFNFNSQHVSGLYKTDREDGVFRSKSWSSGLNRYNLEIFSPVQNNNF